MPNTLLYMACSGRRGVRVSTYVVRHLHCGALRRIYGLILGGRPALQRAAFSTCTAPQMAREPCERVPTEQASMQALLTRP